MPDDIIPGIQAGGQAGAQRGAAGGVDYRQLQNPEGVRTDLPDSGAAARAAALGSVFKEFEGIGLDVYNQASLQAGALAGAASGATGHPQYKQGLSRFTAYSKAFNNAATGAYAIQAEAQADNLAARLRVEANNDPGAFATIYSAAAEGIVKNAPALAQPMLRELYGKNLAAGLGAISSAQAEEQKATQAATWDEGIARQVSRVANLQGSDNPQDQLKALDEQTKLSLLIEGGKNSGLYSEAAAQAKHITSARAITEQVLFTQVGRELARPDGDVVQLMERFRRAHFDNLGNPNEPTILSDAEYQKLYQTAMSQVKDQRIFDMMNKQQGKTEQQLREEAADKLWTANVLNHRATDSQLARAVISGDLKDSTARALHSMIQQGDADVKSNPAALERLRTDPNFLNMTDADIAALPGGPGGISHLDKLAAIKERDQRNNSSENTQEVKDGKATILNALKIKPGTLMASDAEKAAAGNATQEYLTRLHALPPAQQRGAARDLAQEVVKHVQQQEAAAQIQDLKNFRDSAIKNHGPTSSQPWDKARMDSYLKKKDDAIAQAQAAAKGQ